MVLVMKTCIQLVQNFEGFKDDNESEDGDGSDPEIYVSGDAVRCSHSLMMRMILGFRCSYFES